MGSLLRNKRMVLIGGVSGMGEYVTKTCAAEGADIVTVSRVSPDHERAVRVISEARMVGTGKITHIQCDVRDKAATEIAMRHAAEYLGGTIDTLLCGAGDSHIEPFATMSYETMHAEFMDNFYTTMFPCQAVFPYMKENGGLILMCSATATHHPDLKPYTAYISAKSAVNALSRTLAYEWGSYNIRVNCLIPVTETPFTAQNIALENPEVYAQADRVLSNIMLCNDEHDGGWERVKTPQEVADYVAFLASDKATYISAQFIGIDGGMCPSRF